MKLKFLFTFICSLLAYCSFSQQSGPATPLLRHVVLFSFKSTSTSKDIKKIEESFAALPSRIREIKGFEWGMNNSPENLNQGFTHCFLVSFDSEKGRETYLPHPAHKEFVQLLSPHLDKVLVIDYWTGK